MAAIEKMVDEALEIVKECIGEDKLNRIYRPITINTRAKTRWGRCTKGSYGYTIEISDRILSSTVPKNEVMSVLIHEILHIVWMAFSSSRNRRSILRRS